MQSMLNPELADLVNEQTASQAQRQAIARALASAGRPTTNLLAAGTQRQAIPSAP